MQLKANDSYQTYSGTFLKFDIIVVCPNCSKDAIVKPDNFSFQNPDQSDIKAACLHCGYNKKLIDKPTSVLYTSNTRTIKGHVYVVGCAIDPFFIYRYGFRQILKDILCVVTTLNICSFYKDISKRLWESETDKTYQIKV